MPAPEVVQAGTDVRLRAAAGAPVRPLECVDSIGPDGLADTWVDTRVTSRDAQDRAANDLMVQNIVALNQLRQLDPWSTAYIPYNPAPSLLR